MTGNDLRNVVLKAMRDKGIAAARIASAMQVKFPHKPRLLGSSLKVEKSKKDKTLTAIVYLAAADRSKPYGGGNMCPHATPGCRAACLGHTAGQLVFKSSQNAQVWKTLAFIHAREWFKAQLTKEIAAHERRAARKGLSCSVRLNGTSDIAWELVMPELFERFSDVQFYDYTKDRFRMRAFTHDRLPPNYHLTFSRSEDTQLVTIREILSDGGTVAVVFKGDVPETWLERTVIDGDKSDYRAGDPKGVIIGLSVKGRVVDDTGFFV